MSVRVYNDGVLIPHKSFIFSGGEVQVRLTDPPSRVYQAIVRADIRNSNDIMEAFLVTDALYSAYPGIYVKLVCPYFPYARQDRVCYPGEAFSAQVMCNLVNAIGYTEVEVWDAHSDVILVNIDHRVVNKTAWQIMEGWPDAFLNMMLNNETVVVAPDKGAIDRTKHAAWLLNTNMVQAEKVRDPNTGQITGTIVHSDHIGNSNFLMVDDICDGGRTFIELAKKLRPLTNGKVMLYVTHGIFSAGFDVFRGLIDHIYVANCFRSDTPAFVSVMPDTQ